VGKFSPSVRNARFKKASEDLNGSGAFSYGDRLEMTVRLVWKRGRRSYAKKREV